MNTTIAISLLDRATHHIIGRNDPENEFGDPGMINSRFSRPIELNNTVESRDPSWALHMWPDLQEGVLYAHHFRTQISPPFYGYIIRQSMCACFVANSLPVCFSWGCFLSHVRRPWMPGLCSVVSAGCSTRATMLWGLTRPCSDIIYRFNYFLGQFKHQWIHKTSVTTQRVFSPPLRGSPPPPTNHPYVFTCGTGEKSYLKWRAIQLASHQTEHQLNYLV